jgi:D-3-phosphoglycerate dehydrogenase
MARILVSDSLSDEGLGILNNAGMDVDYRPDISQEDIAKEIGNYDALVIRSRTTVTPDILNNAKNLKVIGRAGVGLDNVDVPLATQKGIIVMNTPNGNTISTAEHTMAMMTSLARSIPQADRGMHEGKWEKKKFIGVELYNKTLGVCGFGRIGSEVARRAQAYGMKIMAFDPFINEETVKRMGVTKATVDEICQQADFITVHSPLNAQTKGLLNKERFAMMKKGVRVLNCARGGIIDETALLEALQNGTVAGAALDVFEVEPLPVDHPFRSMDNVIMTPHLGAATSEAQEGVARDVAEQIVDVLTGKMIRNAINAPSVDPAILEQVQPFIDLARRMGRFMYQFVCQPAKKLMVYYSGSVLDFPVAPITNASVIGFLEPMTEGSVVNFVNAGSMAKERGIEVVEQTSNNLYNFANLITMEVTCEDGSTQFIGGTLFTKDTPRIVVLNDKFFDVVPEGEMIVIENRDQPGIIGSVGSVLGKHNINIAQMTWGRTAPGSDAITVINVDQPVSEELIKELEALPNILTARIIRI